MTALQLRSERVALPRGIRPASLQIRDGRIVGVGAHRDRVVGIPERDAGALVVLPGLVDTHVHVNDPGRAEWEGFTHATRAAAAGGVTTVIDMPLNSVPPTTSVAALEAKRDAAAGRCHVDVGFWGGVVPGNGPQLAPLAQAGVCGFKCFLSPSGVDEFPPVTADDLREVLPILAALDLPLLVHAELPSELRDPAAAGDGGPPDPRRYATWLRSRPPAAERAAIDLLLGLAREHAARVHIVHLGTAEAIPAVEAARRAGVRVSVETCPHYLTFAAEDIGDGQTAFKCAPPIRERRDRDRLWQALTAGTIDLVASDHSPSPPAMKELDAGDFVRAWGGIASLQLGLGAVWTGMAERMLSAEHVMRWMADAPARLAGLEGVKGRIAEGHDADLVIWDPDAATIVDGLALYHRHPVTPYHGARLRGSVVTTILRGEVVFDDGRCVGAPRGRLVMPPPAASERET